ncbi:MAG TPA: putative porin, partial [Verrucomicrobiae bacterium]|nr:putative porin [Verrucomicrobiae bacterium]
EGAAERFKYSVGQADFFATFGQFLYADFNPDSASAGLGINSGLGQKTDNIFMFAWQGGLKYNFTTNTSAKIAATLYTYTGLQRSTVNSVGSLSPYFGDPYIGEGAYYLYGGVPPNTAVGVSGYSPGQQFNSLPGYASVSFPMNQVGLNHLSVVEVPFEFNFKISRLDAQVFGDVAYNLQGSQRAQDAAAAYQAVLAAQINPPSLPHSFPAQTHDVKAYQIGFDLASPGSRGLVYGTTSRKNTWEFRTYWQHTEQYALDPNLPDTDFFEGAQNLEGIYAALAYAFSDNFIGTFRYGHANRINNLLGTGGSDTGDIPQINPINTYDIYQVDLTFRF